MNILCATDDNYVPYLGIMLTSLFENNINEEIDVYVLTEILSFNNIATLKRLANIYRNKIYIISVDIDHLGECPIRPNDHVSLAAYYRLIAADVLPESIEKVIYLDCDIIVTDSLSEMWNIDLNGKLLGAVFDESYFEEELYARLGYDPDKMYACSGVLLMDLKKWREIRATRLCAECIEKNADKLLAHDQDTINMLFHDDIKWLHPRYDLQKGHLFTTVSFPEDKTKQIWEAIENPAIIHYTGASKPWYKGCKHPYTPYFLYYKRISLWRDMPLLQFKTTAKGNLHNAIAHIIWFLGLKKRPKSYIIPTQKPVRTTKDN